MDIIEQLGWGHITLGTVLLIVCLLVVTGALVPRHQQRQAIKDRDDQIREWREIHAHDMEANQDLIRAILRMMDGSQTTVELVELVRQQMSNNQTGRETERKLGSEAMKLGYTLENLPPKTLPAPDSVVIAAPLPLPPNNGEHLDEED